MIEWQSARNLRYELGQPRVPDLLVCQALEEVWVVEVHVADLREAGGALDVDFVAVSHPVDHCLFEDHLVAGEGAGLVREDVRDLAQLFVEVRAVDFAVGVCFLRVHLLVERNEDGLDEPHHLRGHQQRDRHEVAA